MKRRAGSLDRLCLSQRIQVRDTRFLRTRSISRGVRRRFLMALSRAAQSMTRNLRSQLRKVSGCTSAGGTTLHTRNFFLSSMPSCSAATSLATRASRNSIQP